MNKKYQFVELVKTWVLAFASSVGSGVGANPEFVGWLADWASQTVGMAYDIQEHTEFSDVHAAVKEFCWWRLHD
jgi:hypothetical protein